MRRPYWPDGAIVSSGPQIETATLLGVKCIVIVYSWRNLLREQIPESVSEDDLEELRAAGYHVSTDIWGEPIARAPGELWSNPATYELARLRFERG